jgi:hypothetical protein
MNAFKGAETFAMPSASPLTVSKLPLFSRRMRQASCRTGFMTKPVSTIATAKTNRLGGVCCTPMALRTISRTTEILVKHVATTAMTGSTDMAAIAARPCARGKVDSISRAMP